MITNEQKLKFADYVLNWLKEEELLLDGDESIDEEQLEETCMAGATICHALLVAGVIEGIRC